MRVAIAKGDNGCIPAQGQHGPHLEWNHEVAQRERTSKTCNQREESFKVFDDAMERFLQPLPTSAPTSSKNPILLSTRRTRYKSRVLPKEPSFNVSRKTRFDCPWPESRPKKRKIPSIATHWLRMYQLLPVNLEEGTQTRDAQSRNTSRRGLFFGGRCYVLPSTHSPLWPGSSPLRP